jgi:predicted amidophosphoribosyltransferase
MLTFTARPGGTALCPMCREAISRQASICPHCRTDLREVPDWNLEPAKAGCAGMVLFLGTVGSGLAYWGVQAFPL